MNVRTFRRNNRIAVLCLYAVVLQSTLYPSSPEASLCHMKLGGGGGGGEKTVSAGTCPNYLISFKTIGSLCGGESIHYVPGNEIRAVIVVCLFSVFVVCIVA